MANEAADFVCTWSKLHINKCCKCHCGGCTKINANNRRASVPNYLISCFLFLFLLFFFCWLQKTTHFRKPQAISGKGQIHPWRLMDLFPVSNLHTSSHTINKSLLCLLILSYQSFPPNSDTNESVLWSMQVNLIYQWNWPWRWALDKGIWELFMM